ncbi:DUF5518 domain-containing protein [Natrinema hispanicum]|uniref:DUF5518 domain-containing protein n=1 Tax=Natrinema hispanicum TaxID=392421 RepID=UPI000B8968BC|nr:DUF5518 domain-containing protein [Natrinema hispanicum]
MPEAGPPLQPGMTQWKYALIGGLCSLPFTTFSYWQTGSELSLGAVFFGGILAGYLIGRVNGEISGVGVRVGIIGGLPVFWVVFDLLTTTFRLAGPVWFVASAIGATIVFAVLGFGISALIGEVGVRVGRWLAGNQHDQSTTVGNS